MNMSLLAFETYFSFKQRSLIIFLLLATVYGFLIHAQDIGEGMDLLVLNAPYRISYFLTLTSVLMSFVIAALCINSLLKDKEYRMSSIIGTLDQKQLRTHRILHIVLSALVISLCFIIGMLTATALGDLPQSRLLQPSIFSYFWPWLIMVVPNIVLVSACLMMTTLKWQSAKLTYAAAMFLVMFFWISIVVINAPITGPTIIAQSDWTMMFAILEPFGSSAFFEQTQHWTPQQKNLLNIDLDGNLLFNRILVLVSSVVLFKLISSHATGDEALSQSLSQRKLIKLSNPSTVCQSLDSSSTDCYFKANITTNIDTISLKSTWLSFAHAVRFEIGQMFSNWPMRILIGLWAILVIIGVLMVAGVFSSGEFSGKYPTSAYLIGHTGEGFRIFALAILVFVVAESVWRERDTNIALLSYATPTDSLIVYLSKVVAAFVIPIVMMAVMLIACLCFQWLVGFEGIDYRYYAVSVYLMLTPTILSIILLFFINSIVANKTNANKYVGMVSGALVLVFIQQGFDDFGLHSPLLHINQLPEFIRGYSELTGFGKKISLFNWVLGYWSLFACLIMVVTLAVWLKKDRINGDNKSSFGRNLAGFIVLVIGFAFYALVISFKMPEQHDFSPADLAKQAQANYEQKYKQFESLQVPQFESSNMQVSVFPKKNKVTIKSSNQITNTHLRSISQIFISAKFRLDSAEIQGAKLIQQEKLNNIYIYLFDLDRPMRAKEQRHFDYSLEINSSIFALNPSVQSNGSYFHQGQFEPILGYARFLEISDQQERARFGLPPKPQLSAQQPFKTNTGYGKFVSQKRHFQTTVSTSAAQTILTSGTLVKQWTQQGRKYSSYKTEQAIFPLVGYFSATYAVKEVKISGVPVSVYYHASHHSNIDEILKATSHTLRYMQDRYGAYPFGTLRLIEVPKFHPFGGRASAGVIALNESLFLQDYQDDAVINNVARNTIHEVVHQWFGEKLVANITTGEKIITESITKHLEAQILGKMYGAPMQQALMDYNKKRFLSGRSYQTTAEVPLISAGDQAYLSYGKGPLAFAAISQHLGESLFDQILHDFIRANQDGMTATLPELLMLFKRSATDPELVDSWFHQVGINQ